MRNWMISLLFRIFFGKEAEQMMGFLWAQKIMNAETVEEAHALYKRVPRLLKDDVRITLIQSGKENLIAE